MPADSFAKRLLAKSRVARRTFRLDKCNIIPVENNLVIIRQGKVYHYAGASQILTHTLDLKNCRNVLHQSVPVVNKSHIYFGEYGMNPNRTEVPVYRSLNGGNTWEVIFLFTQGKIKHVHGCYFDPYEDKIWVFSGDFENECHILCADRDFKNVEWIGDGNQIYRTCNAFFEQDFVHWVMDSQHQDSYHIRLDRKTRKIEKKQIFPGPVWYMKNLQDNFYLAAWAEKIMRFCELRYGSLKNRSVKKCGNINAAQLHMLLLASFLLDHADDSKDMRFLNIVLKLMDLKWIYKKINIINAKIDDVSEFLQCRLLIKTEFILLNL